MPMSLAMAYDFGAYYYYYYYYYYYIIIIIVVVVVCVFIVHAYCSIQQAAPSCWG